MIAVFLMCSLKTQGSLDATLVAERERQKHQTVDREEGIHMNMEPDGG